MKQELKLTNTPIHLIEKNELFSQVEGNLNLIIDKIDDFRIIIGNTESSVFQRNKKVRKKHPYISIILRDGSELVIAPFGNNGLEICKIACSRVGKGNGTRLFRILFQILEELLGFIPELYLECTGAIRHLERVVYNPIYEQTRFFRKFGFRVKDRKGYPNYLRMYRGESSISNQST